MDATTPFFAPEPADPYSVEDAGERTRLMRRLFAEGAMVVLTPPDDEDTAVVSRVLSVDATGGRLELEFVTDAARVAAFREAGRACARASLDGIGLRFALEPIQLIGDAEARRLVAAMPVRLLRLQRREAFRVAPPVTAQPRLFVPLADGEREVRVLDVSATGLAFEWPDADSPPPAGTRLPGCRLELPATVPIRCTLRVRGVEPRPDAPVRVGVELEGLAPTAARSVQVYVNLAQVRSRRARPRLD